MISPCFKASDPQSFYEWLEQIDKVISLMDKDPINLPLQSLKAHSAEPAAHIHPLRYGTKLMNNYAAISAL